MPFIVAAILVELVSVRVMAKLLLIKISRWGEKLHTHLLTLNWYMCLMKESVVPLKKMIGDVVTRSLFVLGVVLHKK